MMTPATTTAEMSFYSNTSMSGIQKDPKKVAGLFEAMFYRELLKTVHDDENQDPLFDSFDMKQVQEMYDDEFSIRLGAMGHLGIGDMVLASTHETDPQNPQTDQQPLGLLKAPAK